MFKARNERNLDETFSPFDDLLFENILIMAMNLEKISIPNEAQNQWALVCPAINDSDEGNNNEQLINIFTTFSDRSFDLGDITSWFDQRYNGLGNEKKQNNRKELLKILQKEKPSNISTEKTVQKSRGLHKVARDVDNPRGVARKIREKIQTHQYSIDVLDEKNRTPLMLACGGGQAKFKKTYRSGGCIESVNLLVETGAKLQMQSQTGDTALMYATSAGYAKIVHYLITRIHFTNIDLKNNANETALTIACKAGELKIINLLLEKGAKIRHIPSENYALFSDEVKEILDNHPQTPSPSVSKKNTAEECKDDKMPWANGVFKDRFMKAAKNDPQQNFINDEAAQPQQSVTWTQKTLDRIIERVIANYAQHYEEYQDADPHITKKQYHAERLVVLQDFSSAAGYQRFINAAQMMLTFDFKFGLDEKLPVNVTQEFLDMLILLGVFYESRSALASENFYALHFLLIMLLEIKKSPEKTTNNLVDMINKGRRFYIDDSSEKPANLGFSIRNALITAFDQLAMAPNPRHCDQPAREAYNVLGRLIGGLKGTLEKLIFESEEQYCSKSHRSLSTSVSIPVITTSESPSELSGSKRSLSLRSLRNSLSFSLTPPPRAHSDSDISSHAPKLSFRKGKDN